MNSVIKKQLSAALENFWFKDSSAINLGIYRIIFYFIAACIFYQTETALIPRLDEILYYPVLFYRLLGFSHQTVDGLALARTLGIVSSGLAMIGLFTRTSMALCFLSGFYLFSARYQYGFTHELESCFVIALLIFASSSAGLVMSLDCRFRKRIKQSSYVGEFFWPIQLIRFTWCFLFFTAFVWKILSSGLQWFQYDMLKIFFLRFADYYAVLTRPTANISLELRNLLISSEYLGIVLNLITILLEATMPLAFAWLPWESFKNRFPAKTQ